MIFESPKSAIFTSLNVPDLSQRSFQVYDPRGNGGASSRLEAMRMFSGLEGLLSTSFKTF